MVKDIYELRQKLEPHFLDGAFCGIDIEDGWIVLVDELHDNLIKIDPWYKLLQVKEKFGGLRFYANHNHKKQCLPVNHVDGDFEECKFHDAVSIAETKSWSICRNCGEPSSVSGLVDASQWIPYKSLCVSCRESDGDR